MAIVYPPNMDRTRFISLCLYNPSRITGPNSFIHQGIAEGPWWPPIPVSTQAYTSIPYIICKHARLLYRMRFSALVLTGNWYFISEVKFTGSPITSTWSIMFEVATSYAVSCSACNTILKTHFLTGRQETTEHCNFQSMSIKVTYSSILHIPTVKFCVQYLALYYSRLMSLCVKASHRDNRRNPKMASEGDSAELLHVERVWHILQ